MKRLSIFLILTLLLTNAMAEKPRVGIVLSGGGALGFAHIGALQAFADNGIEFDGVAGASMGAIVGSLYASGKTPQEMMEIVKQNRLNKVLKLVSSSRATRTGWSSHKTLRKVLTKELSSDSFDSLPTPFFVSITNLTKAQSEIVGSGNNLIDYVIASASVPGVFEVMTIDNDQYVDGGVLNNLPAQALTTSCDVIVGVDVFAHVGKLPPLKRAKNVALHSIRLMQEKNSEEGRLLCDFLIEPRLLERFSELDFENYKEIYQCGYDAVTQFIEENPKILQLKKQ